MTVRVIIAALTLLCVSGASTQSMLPAGLAEKLDALVAAEFAKDGVVGAATVGVVKGGSLVWVKAERYLPEINKIGKRIEGAPPWGVRRSSPTLTSCGHRCSRHWA